MGRPVIAMTKNINILGQTFILHPSGGMFWEEEDLLVISDVHLGKVAHFRKHGSAIPQLALKGNFLKLDLVTGFFDPKKIIFLGDLFHSYINYEWQHFDQWMQDISAEVVLVEGNHDVISPKKYEALGVKVIPELIIGDFLFTHHPEERENCFNFSGHIHPGVKINGMARQQLKLPCFFRRQNQMILPAFGEFTGKHILEPKAGDEVYVVTKEEVIYLNT
ncbi:DEAD/DEAH box helicase [Salinimicrobium marinum]|uniref:DEAD/DEAH box helicase n=1 Tax=Salinimicrobium marinum TaxID=680283 RepID=A0A918S4A3_9FLAO|nr:ligase-associated DNA damage response endonuclease PdeM [Salinimicrobium marinum]GHA23253.1 DEAD/DEAH box helicase [Salinimicrobium marinum]